MKKLKKKPTKKKLETQASEMKKANKKIRAPCKGLEEKNRQLQEISRLKNEFVNTVSHELRTPLSITKEGISLILDRIPGEINQKQENILNTAKDNIDRLGRIINNLLDISKIESGRIELTKEMVDIADLAKKVLVSFEGLARQKGLRLRLNVPHTAIETYVDRDKIMQVFTNLVGNAIKFTEQGYVEVGVKQTQKYIECFVSDTGRGICKKDIAKLFTEFQQLRSDVGAGEKGTGLGLAITKVIVQIHEGSIRAESQLGKGAKFTFTLPRYSTELLFKETIKNGIKVALSNASKSSFIVVSFTGFADLRRCLSDDRLRSMLYVLRRVLEDTLRREGDSVVKDTGEIIVVLSNCGKDNLPRVKKRISEALDKYLASQKLCDKITSEFSVATYPDDGENEEDLFNKIRG